MNEQEIQVEALLIKDEEKRLFSKMQLASGLTTKLRYTPGRFDIYDVAFVLTKQPKQCCLGEIKIRREELAYFSMNKPLLEHQKYVALLEVKHQIKLTANCDVDLYYFNFTADNYVQIFKLKEKRGSYKYNELYLPENDFNPHIKKWKMVTFLENPIQVLKI